MYVISLGPGNSSRDMQGLQLVVSVCFSTVMLPSESIARCLLVPYSLVYDQIPAKLTAALPVLSVLFHWSLISI